VVTGRVGAAVVRVGEGAAGLVTARVGLADGPGRAVVRPAVPAGGPPGVVVALRPAVGVPPPPSGEGTSLPDRCGAGPSAWVPVVPPSTWDSRWATPGSSPEETATAPAAMAADEASSPVRIGWCLRRPRWLRGPGRAAAGWACRL
jgi:hypothetical protein